MPFKHYIIVSSVLKVSSDDTPQLHHIAENFRGRKLSREKTFANFMVVWLFVKVFSAKFWGMVSFGAAKASNPQNFFAKIVFLTNLQKFSLESFPLYGILEKLVEETAL